MNQKLIIDKDGNAILQGRICPFRNPLVFPTSLGSVEIQNLPCASSCVHFRIDNNSKYKEAVSLTCSGREITIEVEIENQNKSKSNLIV